jgi:hypothetical protein
MKEGKRARQGPYGTIEEAKEVRDRLYPPRLCKCGNPLRKNAEVCRSCRYPMDLARSCNSKGDGKIGSRALMLAYNTERIDAKKQVDFAARDTGFAPYEFHHVSRKHNAQ